MRGAGSPGCCGDGGTRSVWPYLLAPGSISWAGFYLGGLHPALALVPILPFLPHAARDAGIFVEPAEPPHDTLSGFASWWKTPVEIILFFCVDECRRSPDQRRHATWMVLAALVAGKPLGILIATWAAERVGFRRAEGLAWSAMLVLGVTAGIGFTVALFFTTASFEPGPTLEQAKLGAQLSVSAGLLAIVAGKVMKV